MLYLMVADESEKKHTAGCKTSVSDETRKYLDEMRSMDHGGKLRLPINKFIDNPKFTKPNTNNP